jgi:predicted phosphoadenosine phosphosulfate sulfurtransferase
LATVLQYCKVMFNLTDGFCINCFSMNFSMVDWQIGPLCKWFATHCATVGMTFHLYELSYADKVGWSSQRICHTMCNCMAFPLYELSYVD